MVREEQPGPVNEAAIAEELVGLLTGPVPSLVVFTIIAHRLIRKKAE
jgi:hypothetical protein